MKPKKKKQTPTNPLKALFDWVKDRNEDKSLDLTNPKTSERAKDLFQLGLEKLRKRLIGDSLSTFRKTLTKRYYRYIKNDITKNNIGLKSYKLSDLKPKFRKDLTNRISMSLDLIKTQNDINLGKLQNRFLNWINKTNDGLDKDTLRQELELTATTQKEKRHIRFILKDQTMKMVSSFDEIVANEYDAIAFIWKTRKDNRVVGNPKGKYPEAKDNDNMHGNHYKREGQYYFYPNSWALKQNKLNKKAITLTTELKDGMPGKPIGCRCYAVNIYELEDLPDKFLKTI